MEMKQGSYLSSMKLISEGVAILIPTGPSLMRAARTLTRSIPIVTFDLESDPVESGWLEGYAHPIVFVLLNDAIAEKYVASFARPSGTITGFASTELTLVGKRLALLRELSPGIRRVLYITNRFVGAGTGDLLVRLGEDAAAAGVTLIDGSTENDDEIEAAVRLCARDGGGGIIAAFNAFTTVHREAIIAAASRYRVPAIYPLRSFADGGGLLSYGFDQDDQFRQAAAYVDRILRGEKAGDLPVQEPTKFEMIFEPENRQGAGPHGPFDAACSRRRGD
jgi:putative tryptophan/tyrosine transport system substrate-binding protein